MKSYEERTEYIISEIKKRTEAKRKRRITLKRTASLAACFCFTVIFGSHVFSHMKIMNKTPIIEINTPALSELPDPYAVKNISAYVSKVMEITNTGGAYTYENCVSVKETQPPAKTTVPRIPVTNVTAPETGSDENGSADGYAGTPEREEVMDITNTGEDYTDGNYVSVKKTQPPAKTTVPRIPVTNVTEPETGSDENGSANGYAGTPEWENMSVYQQFDTILFNDILYIAAGITINPGSLAEKAGDITADSTDTLTNKIHYINAEIFRIKNSADSQSIAVRFEDHEEYYVYTGINK